MTRKEAIKICTREKECVQAALDACADGGHYVSPDGIIKAADYVEAMGMAIAALREQPRWISVEERLPETGMHGTSRVVLAWEPEHGRCFAMVYDKGQGKRWFSGGAEIPNITHWMPLPDAPEVEV